MFVVIGSNALYVQSPDGWEPPRSPADTDLVGDYDELVTFLKNRDCKIMPIDGGKKIVGRNAHEIFECEITWPGSLSKELYDLIVKDVDSYWFAKYVYPSYDIQYMLKMTHRFKKNSPHFKKTMGDIKYLRSMGAKIRPEHRDFYTRRKKATLDYGHPKLNQGKKDFFTDDVPYVYDHDSIHDAVKLYNIPAYQFFKPTDSEVLTDKKMFFNIEDRFRLAAVYEEASVLALERSQIPYPYTDPAKSFEIALEKICTSITSGWFREYAWENYDRVMELYNREPRGYIDRFAMALEQGKVKPYEGLVY